MVAGNFNNEAYLSNHSRKAIIFSSENEKQLLRLSNQLFVDLKHADEPFTLAFKGKGLDIGQR